MNKQLREKIKKISDDSILLTDDDWELKYGEQSYIDAILSIIDEALPKEETGFSFLMFKMGYNACLSDIHQLLKGGKI
jgi:hypothetical protein